MTPVLRIISLDLSVLFGLYLMIGNGIETVDLAVITGFLICIVAAVILGNEYRKIPMRTKKNMEMNGNREFL